MSSAVTTAFATVLSLGLSRVINTGDRALDNALLTLLVALNGMLMAALADDKVYNKFIYHFIDRPKKSTQFTKGLYKYNDLIEDYKKHRNSEKADIYYSLSRAYKRNLGINETIASIKLSVAINSVSSSSVIQHSVSNSNSPIYVWVIAVYNAEFVYYTMYNSTSGIVKNVFSTSKIALDEFCKEFGLNEEEKPSTVPKICYNGIQPKGTVSSRKTFDTLFYDQKPQLLRLLEKFKTQTLYPDTISMDNKLGILLYGPPGTGKTGTISAIANYLQRDIMIVNFAELTKSSDVDGLLKEEYCKKYIYVFEEFDCILDVMAQGNMSLEEPTEKTDWASLLAVAEKEERQKILEMMRETVKKTKKPDRIDLGYLLQKLDGIEDNNDRIIIATTNHPEKINPALLRPGRFDLKLCLGNCSAQMIEDILTNFFKGGDDLRLQIAKAGIPAGKWSPLQVINTAIVCETLEKTLEALSKN